MGGEKVTAEVGDTVANGTVSPTKSDNDVSEKKDGNHEGVDEMCVDTEAEVKDKNEEVNVDQKDAEVSKDDKEEEEEVKDSKEEGEDERKEEAKSDAMEVDDVGSADEQHDDKVAEIADLEEEASKKRATKKTKVDKRKGTTPVRNIEPKTPVGPTIDRPIRERKSVERLVAIIEQDSFKEFNIEKGRGTALKDIPNVALKLSKKKVADDTLKLLHTVLFVKRGKALEIKSNILRFSGFVWHENEEKQKAKVHEKLDKLNKEKLFEFCDLLDVPVTKTTAKKEDVIATLIEFLLAPHATTSELLAEKEQSSKGNKRKRANKKSASASEATPSKNSAKKSKGASEEQKGTPETEDSEEEPEDEKDENHNANGGPAKSESDEHASEPESEEEDNKKRKRDSKKSSSKTELSSRTKLKKEAKKEATPKKLSPLKKTPTESSTMQSKSKDKSESQPPTKTFSRKKKNHVVDEKSLTSKKSASKEKTEVKKAGKEKETPKEEKLKPSDDELKTAICEILKVADFNTATFTDILKLLNKRFGTELTPRKATVKSIVKEELTKLVDEEDDETEAAKTEKETSTAKA